MNLLDGAPRARSRAKRSQGRAGRLVLSLCLRASVFGVVLLSLGAWPAAAEPLSAESEAYVKSMAERSPFVDGLNGLGLNIHRRTQGRLGEIDILAGTSRLAPPMATDIPRLRQGKLGALVATFAPPADSSGASALLSAVEQLDSAARLVARNDADLRHAKTADDVFAAHREGAIAVLFHLADGRATAGSIATLRTLAQLGVVSMAVRSPGVMERGDDGQGGLSAFGQMALIEMNRLGIVVDLMGAGARTVTEALTASQAPLVWTAAGASALCRHPQNATDDQLRQLARAEGVVLVPFHSVLVSEEVRSWAELESREYARLLEAHGAGATAVVRGLDAWRQRHPRPRASISQVVDHIDHIKKLVGVDSVGFASGFDAMPEGPIGLWMPEGPIGHGNAQAPKGLEDPSHLPMLVVELAKRGYSDSEIWRVMGDNHLRVLRQAQNVAKRLAGHRAPAEPLPNAAATPPPAPGAASPR